jgi:hypothetical protein
MPIDKPYEMPEACLGHANFLAEVSVVVPKYALDSDNPNIITRSVHLRPSEETVGVDLSQQNEVQVQDFLMFAIFDDVEQQQYFGVSFQGLQDSLAIRSPRHEGVCDKWRTSVVE